jgi:hypothetical protein
MDVEISTIARSSINRSGDLGKLDKDRNLGRAENNRIKTKNIALCLTKST